MSRIWVWPLLVLAALMVRPTDAAQPAPSPRIVAIGDLHGDNDAWVAIASAAGLIDRKGKWSGGNATLVQLGDVADRGPDSLKIVNSLMRLQGEARRRGGRVIALVGNHEAMNMTGDLRYVHPGEYTAFATRDSEGIRENFYENHQAAIEAAYRAQSPAMSQAVIRQTWMKSMPLGKLEHQAAWSPSGRIGRWIVGNPAVAKVGDTLFVHGGISASYVATPIEELNRKVTDALRRQDETPTAIINEPRGPLWYRGLVTRSGTDETSVTPVGAATAPPLTMDQEIDLVLRSYGVKRIVVGHTPQKAAIMPADGGKLWPIDTAISRAYGGTLSYLEIVGDKVTGHSIPRPAGASWGGRQ